MTKTAPNVLDYASPPSLWRSYARVVTSGKSGHVGDGHTVPRLEARLEPARVDAGHLVRYARLCGATPAPQLPIAYPHVLASPLHLALLADARFPVRVFGLVHVANRITCNRPIATGEMLALRVVLEGHREAERGQEFDLETEVRVGGELVWTETCTFLARRRARGAPGTRRAESTRQSPEDRAGVITSSFAAPSSIGRSYGLVSGDVNPIHLTDLSAKAFGFPGAIAHGMWTMARVCSELGAMPEPGPATLAVDFRQPVFLPARVMLHRWRDGQDWAFALRDAEDGKTHLTGTLGATRA